jgi:hypothetical protein
MQVLPILSSKRALWTLVVHRRRRRPPIFAILPPQPRNGRKSSSFPERNRNRLIGRAEIFIWHWNRNEEIALPAMHGRKSKTKAEVKRDERGTAGIAACRGFGEAVGEIGEECRIEDLQRCAVTACARLKMHD